MKKMRGKFKTDKDSIHSVSVGSDTFFGAYLAHQLFNLVRKASLNKFTRTVKSPFPLRRTRYSYESERKYELLYIIFYIHYKK